MTKTYRYLIAFAAALLLLAGCKHRVTDTSGAARKTATGMPEAPYMLEGDYTPDTGVMYKVVVGGDTCFVVVDSLSDTAIYGYYYQLMPECDTVWRAPFSYDRHWRNQRKGSLLYLYQPPAFVRVADSLYRTPAFEVKVQPDIEYGQALGYWVSNRIDNNEGYGEILANGLLNSLIRTTQSLTMDVYLPDNNDTLRPLLLLLHGGAFYVGDKQDTAISRWCQHFASLGYVAVSANYRMGFLPSKGEIARAGYMALQDAHAAMRYLVDHAATLGIDTSMLFVGGASAGAITALNLAFMRDEDRPSQAHKRQWRDLGLIAASGNSSQAKFHIRAVANMWGAVNNLDLLKNSHTNIVSFHGDADLVVPYDNGFPFSDISKRLGKRMFDRMYGSLPIDKRARQLGLRSTLYTYRGEGHSLHHHADGSWNEENFGSIRDRMSAFFYSEIAGPRPHIVADSLDARHFYIASDAEVADVSWQVEGGLITRLDGSDIWVVWCNDSPQHALRASGHNAKGFGFYSRLTK